MTSYSLYLDDVMTPDSVLDELGSGTDVSDPSPLYATQLSGLVVETQKRAHKKQFCGSELT